MSGSTTTTRTMPTPPAAGEPTFEDMARRVDDAAGAVADLDGPTREAAEELRSAVEEIHRAGLRTIVRAMRDRPETREVLFELVDDPVVHLLLSLHEIIRPDPATQAKQVLVDVRPQLQSHGGDVTLDHVADGVAYVQLAGACNGCSMSAVTLRNVVEEALVAGVPSITAVEVLPTAPSPALISVDSLFSRSDPAQEGWVDALAVTELGSGQLVPRRLEATDGTVAEVILVNVEDRLSAYLNSCAHQGLPLDNALLDVQAKTLTCPWHGFCYDASSGECLSSPGAQLEQLPLRVDDGRVWVRVRS